MVAPYDRSTRGVRPSGAGHGCARRHDRAPYLTSTPRLCFVPRAIFSFLCGDVSMGDDRSSANATWMTWLANARDMNVSTPGSLLLRLSHQRNGLLTQPPSVPGTVPSKLPGKPPNRVTHSWVLQQS